MSSRRKVKDQTQNTMADNIAQKYMNVAKANTPQLIGKNNDKKQKIVEGYKAIMKSNSAMRNVYKKYISDTKTLWVENPKMLTFKGYKLHPQEYAQGRWGQFYWITNSEGYDVQIGNKFIKHITMPIDLNAAKGVDMKSRIHITYWDNSHKYLGQRSGITDLETYILTESYRVIMAAQPIEYKILKNTNTYKALQRRISKAQEVIDNKTKRNKEKQNQQRSNCK